MKGEKEKYHLSNSCSTVVREEKNETKVQRKLPKNPMFRWSIFCYSSRNTNKSNSCVDVFFIVRPHEWVVHNKLLSCCCCCCLTVCCLEVFTHFVTVPCQLFYFAAPVNSTIFACANFPYERVVFNPPFFILDCRASRRSLSVCFCPTGNSNLDGSLSDDFWGY